MNHHTAVLFNGAALCLILWLAQLFLMGLLSASPGFVLMGLCLLDLVALSNHHTAVFNGGAMSA